MMPGPMNISSYTMSNATPWLQYNMHYTTFHVDFTSELLKQIVDSMYSMRQKELPYLKSE